METRWLLFLSQDSRGTFGFRRKLSGASEWRSSDDRSQPFRAEILGVSIVTVQYRQRFEASATGPSREPLALASPASRKPLKRPVERPLDFCRIANLAVALPCSSAFSSESL